MVTIPTATLPIDSLLPDIRKAVAENPAVLIQAAPGAGKTTRVPSALLDVVEGQILVLEPRRLAARLSAERVASEMGERTGETIGFHIRQNRSESSRTKVKFITEGLLLRYLVSSPDLAGVGALILDEFHERHLQTDVALAVARHLQASLRPDLKLLVMSATLEASPLSEWLGGAPVLRSEGTVFPVTHVHSPVSSRPLALQVRDAVSSLCRDPRCPGHILVFLSGLADIRRCAAALEPIAGDLGVEVLELRGDLPLPQQQRVFAPSGKRKVVLSTNVAETSVTIEGVTGVVDSGLAKIPGYAFWSGLPTLEERPVSQASCAQRAGRAGRTAPGVVVRLYSASDHASRPPFEVPEIQRLDLTQTMLDWSAVEDALPHHARVKAEDLPWYAPPPSRMLTSAQETLHLLGALDGGGRLTPIGRQMAHYPLHPRLSRALVESRRLGCSAHVALGVALVSEGMLLPRGKAADVIEASDIGYQSELFMEASGDSPSRFGQSGASRRGGVRSLVGESGVRPDPGRIRRVEELLRQILPMVGSRYCDLDSQAPEESVARCFLAGFPDRVARTRRTSGMRNVGITDAVELLLCQGGGARLSPSSVVRDDEYLIAIEAEENLSIRDASRSSQIRVAVGISPELLLEDPAGLIRTDRELVWDESAARPRGSERLLYGVLPLEELPLSPDDPGLELLLRQELERHWPQPFSGDAPLREYGVRRRLLQEAGLGADLPDLTGEDFPLFLDALCSGRRSFSEIASRPLGDWIRDQISPAAYRQLEEYAPERLSIGAGRKVPVHYEEGGAPWIASRLQDFFGTVRSPSIAGGRVPLLLHLLAPNGHDLQVTTDLEGFWDRTYPALRREYSRRYPRHSWPEDPRQAEPPPAGGRRGHSRG